MSSNITIAIEHDVPLPPKRNRIGVTDAVRKMKIGDSFLATQRQRNAAFAAAHGLGVKLTSRRMNDELDQIRVWRIK